ncbi:TRAP transporter large permease subunit [Leucobacter sp. gxy201]|uniref:TRAP transporter large permease n=1 Tax=Leucobacter sp. gxy201 TaxID=2957200 RepID=UPI003DA0DF70
MALIFGFLLLITLIVVGVPIVYAFGAVIIWLVIALGYEPSFLIPTAYNSLNGVVLLAIPLFVMAGGVMAKGEIGEALVGVVENFVGRVRGALNIVQTVTCAVFGSISGSGAATLSAIGSIMAPKMRARGYNMGVAAAVLAAAAPIGMLIPPSSIQILFAWSAQLSVLAAFLSTLIPGLILTVLISIVGWTMSRRDQNIVLSAPVTKREWLLNTRKSTLFATPALVMPVIILGGIYFGVMTPTEAAAVSVVYAIPVGMFFYRKLTLKGLKETLVETANTTGVIMVMLAVIMVLSRILVMENVPDKILDVLLLVSENKYVILLMINVFLIVIGMLMDDVSGTLLCAPILVPIGLELGVSPYHMAAILGVNLGMGNVTPPTAPFLYLGARIFNTPVKGMLRPMLCILVFAYLPTLLLTTFVPELALWLPGTLLGIK